jgi:hypothetical protein
MLLIFGGADSGPTIPGDNSASGQIALAVAVVVSASS